jgi:hypothetical protein
MELNETRNANQGDLCDQSSSQKRLSKRRLRIDDSVGRILMSSASLDDCAKDVGVALRQQLHRVAKARGAGGLKRSVGTRRDADLSLQNSSSARRLRRTAGKGASASPQLWDTRQAIASMVRSLELLPQNSRYVQHKLKCAQKAMELLESERRGSAADASLYELLSQDEWSFLRVVPPF